jgi:hypothetical protein
MFNDIEWSLMRSGIEQYFLSVKEIKQDYVDKFCLELYHFGNLSNFTLEQ